MRTSGLCVPLALKDLTEYVRRRFPPLAAISEDIAQDAVWITSQTDLHGEDFIRYSKATAHKLCLKALAQRKKERRRNEEYKYFAQAVKHRTREDDIEEAALKQFYDELVEIFEERLDARRKKGEKKLAELCEEKFYRGGALPEICETLDVPYLPYRKRFYRFLEGYRQAVRRRFNVRLVEGQLHPAVAIRLKRIEKQKLDKE